MMNNPILAEFLNEVWAMEPRALEAFIAQVSALGERVKFSAGPFASEPRRQSAMTIRDGVAEIPIQGVLLKRVPMIFRWFGIQASSYSDIQEDIKSALEDRSVKSIRLKIESPGGQVSGVMEAAEAIYKARTEKPVGAYIEDIGASGAYWLAAQANRIDANANAVVGSIGVYSVAVDYSKAAEMEGIKVHVIASGPHKGAGVPGSEIKPEHLEALQEVINGMAENFISDVARGRQETPEKVREWASGKTWLAAAANEMGLIDKITNGISKGPKGAPDGPEAAEIRPSSQKGESEMADKVGTPPAAPGAVDTSAQAPPDPVAIERKRCAEIRAAFPGEDKFALDQIASGASVEQAKIAFADVLRERNAKLEKENAELKAAQTTALAGAPPLLQSGEAGRGEQDFMARAEALRQEKGIKLNEAMSLIARTDPAAYAKHIEYCKDQAPGYNANKRREGVK